VSNKKLKVAVGMSGGVDSSVSALLLKEQGYDVVGVFLKFWHDTTCDTNRENACCDERALMDARSVADKLEIPLYVVDVRSEFKKEIADYFIDEYKNLRTPNPCVVCNKKIKFGWFLDFAKKIGCDFVATGHYARIKCHFDPSKRLDLPAGKAGKSSERSLDSARDDNRVATYSLLKGVDQSKDQSYFLYQLDQDQLSRIIFPVGEMTKVEVREIAKKKNLPVFEKRESQEICFVADNDYRKFLKRHLPEKYFEAGDIVDLDGRLLGQHEGLINYTIGQRKGVNQEKRVTFNGEAKDAMYVTGFDKEKNELIVGEDKALWKKEFVIESARFDDSDNLPDDITVKIRYRAKEIPCEITSMGSDTSCLIRLSEIVRAITPGQSAVFYSGDEVVGGGIITKD